MRKVTRFVKHGAMAVLGLTVLLIVTFYVWKGVSALPAVGGVGAWAGQHASGTSEGF